MKPESRSTREVAPERFEAHGEGNPHDLMSRRAQKYEEKLQTKVKKVKKVKAMKKQIYRSEKKLVESVEEKDQSRKKETERKKLWRQKKKDESLWEPLEDKEKNRKRETERRQRYRKKKMAEKEGGKA